MRDIKWTQEQRRAIETADKNLLVSAAAGSGKTAVLAARCVWLTLDAPSGQRCDVDELLVVTFTVAAAEEMRHRIGKRLRDRTESVADDARVRRQLLLLDRAPISTIHALCSNLIRQHFHAAGVDPAFRQLDGDEALLLRRRVARDLVLEEFEREQPGTFHRLIEEYAGGYDDTLIDNLLSADAYLSSMDDPAAWTTAALQRLHDGAAKPLIESELGRAMIEMMRRETRLVADDARRVTTHLQHVEGAEKYVAHFIEVCNLIETAETIVRRGDLDALRIFIEENKLPRLPAIKNPSAEMAEARKDIDRVKDGFRKLVNSPLMQFTPAQWQDNLATTIWAADAFFGLVADFRKRYDAAKAELRALDFSDLERVALNLLRDHSGGPTPIALEMHKRFRHVLVDEFQDINDAQAALLNLLSRECLGEAFLEPNLFCVGDVKQSIYRFRHAEPRRFVARADALRDPSQSRGITIDLKKNYRSRKPLLDVLNGLFERLMQRAAGDVDYDETQALVAGKTFPADPAGFVGSPIELHLIDEEAIERSTDEQLKRLDKTEIEAAVVAQRIRELVGGVGTAPARVSDGADGLRPAHFGDIVVLLRTAKFKVEQFASILRRAGIPVQTQSTTGFFKALEIQDVMAVLRLLDNRRQDLPLAAYLRSPLANLPRPEDALALVRLRYPARDSTVAFHQAIERYVVEQRDDLAKDLKSVLEQVERWRVASRERPVAETVWAILQETGYLTYVTGLLDGPQRVANLLALHDRARQFGSFQRQGLARFLEFLDNLQEESDLGQPNIAVEEQAVRVLTIHKSKGLEFPIVIVPDLGKKFNMLDANSGLVFERRTGIAFDCVDADREIRYTSLAKLVASDRVRRATISEELRVLYVALTRAQEHLILVGGVDKPQPETWRDRWAGHFGKLSSAQVLAAHSMLDWIGPVSTLMNDEKPGQFEYTFHDGEKQAALAALGPTRTTVLALDPVREKKPLTIAPVRSDVADRILARVSFEYAHRDLTNIPAAAAVTALTKTGSVAPGDRAGTTNAVLKFEQVLQPPRAVAEDQELSAAQAGSATHAFLQHIDFSQAATRQDLARQLDALIDRRILRADEAAAVDLDGLAWFMASPEGTLVRAHARELRREFEIVFPYTPAVQPGVIAGDGDRVMVRGRIDLVIPTADGLVVIDYKTDRVTEETIDARAEFYREQARTYCEELTKITKRPVTATHLVFLTPRLTKTM